MDSFRECVSEPRFRRYVAASRSDRDAVERYCWKIQLSESLYPTLSILEVSLRNGAHRALSDHLGTEFWFGSILHPRKYQNIADLIARITSRAGGPPTADKVVSEITFGFWLSLFSRRYNAVWWQPHDPLLAKVIPHHPNIARDTRRHLEITLEYAVALRNRVMHHEAVFQGVTALNRPRKSVEEIHLELRELVRWISPQADRMLDELDRFPMVFGAFPDEGVIGIARAIA